MKTLVLLSLFLFSIYAHAVITIQSIGGVSYSEKDTNGVITAYGGMAGACTGDGTSTCNSCVSASLPAKACNPNRVYPTLPISITYISSIALSSALVHIYTEEQETVTKAADYSPANASVSGAIGTIYTATLNWGYLCLHDSGFGSSTACTPLTSSEQSFVNPARKIHLWVDEDGDGVEDEGEAKTVAIQLHYIDENTPQQTFCSANDPSAIGACGYKLGVGDSKFYLEGFYNATGGTPVKSATAPEWYGVALFASTASDVTQIPSTYPGASVVQIQPYNSTYGLDDNTISGLQNYTTYCLMMGNINKAKNIYKFNTLGGSVPLNCAQPSEVIGMLTDKSCFISTAAFGSDMADQVQLLRKFRNDFLLTNDWGKTFVKTYYKFSPPIAHFIEHSEILKAMTRTVLYPFIALAWLAVNYGILPALMVLFLVFSSLYFIFKKNRITHA